MNKTVYSGIDFRELFKFLLKKWWIILIFFLFFTLATSYVSFFVLDDVYTAQTTLFIGKEKGVLESISLSTISVNTQLINDYIEILKSRTLAEEVIKQLNIDMSPAEFRGRINVSEVTGSRMLIVSFDHHDPVLAADIVNKTSQIIIIKAKEIIGVQNLQVIDEALVPKYPSKPDRKKIIILGSIMGIFVAILIVFIMEYLDYTFKSIDDIESITGIKVIGVIPKFKGEKRKGVT
jgi:capsular polysaccharide biosynthesis protein